MKRVAEAQLTLEAERLEHYPCLRLRGEADVAGARVLRSALEALLAQGCTRVVLDTRQLRFLDLYCSKALEAAAAEFQERGGQLVVVDPSLPVERILKLLDVEHLVPVLSTVAQAVALLDEYE